MSVICLSTRERKPELIIQKQEKLAQKTDMMHLALMCQAIEQPAAGQTAVPSA